MITEILKKLGFTDKEIKIYLLIVKHSRITPPDLARSSGINRATVYAIAKSLVVKGLVTEELGGKTLSLLPASSQELQKLNRKHEQEIKMREKATNELIEELALRQVGAEYQVSKIRFVEDKDIEDYLYDNFKKLVESMQKYDNAWWGFQDHSLVEHYTKWIDWSWKQTPKEIELKLLSNKSVIEERLHGKYPKRKIKFWEKSGSFTATTWIMGDYIVMIMTHKKPFYLVQIYDPVMAYNQREIFKNLWSLI